MMSFRYGYTILGIRTFEAKIKEDNHASIKMFERMGFVEKSYSNVFKEFTYENSLEEDKLKW